jgi:hypothetical protein
MTFNKDWFNAIHLKVGFSRIFLLGYMWAYLKGFASRECAGALEEMKSEQSIMVPVTL